MLGRRMEVMEKCLNDTRSHGGEVTSSSQTLGDIGRWGSHIAWSDTGKYEGEVTSPGHTLGFMVEGHIAWSNIGRYGGRVTSPGHTLRDMGDRSNRLVRHRR